MEIKSPDYNKGSEVRRQLEKKHYDFIIAMGDDTTDEDMFKALPVNAVTIKVGYVSEAASYNMPSQTEVLPFLQILANKKDMKQPIGENVKTSLKGSKTFYEVHTVHFRIQARILSDNVRHSGRKAADRDYSGAFVRI